ncbi:uncharacterized protein CLBA1 [Eudromia elegans]
MQDLSLVESLSNTDTLRCVSPKDLAADVSDMSLQESDCDSTERRNKEEMIKLEVMKQSLPVVNSKGSCEGVCDSSHSTIEISGSWGDFEGFKESLNKSETFSHNPEVSGKSMRPSKGDTDLHRGHCDALTGNFSSDPSLHAGRQEASRSLNEVNRSSEDIFKMGFPEVTVPQSRESIRSLDQVFDTNNEDTGTPDFRKNQLCIDCGNIWRILKDSDNTSSLRHPWSKSHCQENLLSVLGINANQKDFPESQEDIVDESNAKDDEDFGFDGFSINNCKALIQTKLSVSPDSRDGRLFTCNLFLTRPASSGNVKYITIPRKKQTFTTHNLKMKFFSNDIC